MNRVAPPPTLAWPLTDRPRIRIAVRAPLDDRGFAVRYHGGFHALHLYDYAGTIRMDEHRFELRPGDVTLTPAGVETRYDLPRPGTHLVLHFHSACATPDPRDTVDLPLHLSLGEQRPAAEVRLMRIIHTHAMAENDRLAEANASAALQELLLWLAIRARQTPGTGGPTLDRATQSAMELIDHRLDRSLNVPDLARQVGLSQNYLARRFRERFGMTMQSYLLARRIELARELLVSTDLSVKTIGVRVGMPDPQYFNKRFRQRTGMSPSAMRRNRA